MTLRYPRHPQECASNGVLIDKNISELLEMLWRAGFETEESCERWGAQTWGPADKCPPDWAYIKFVNVKQARRFSAALSEYLQFGVPFGEGPKVFIGFPADDIAAVTLYWRKQATP